MKFVFIFLFIIIFICNISSITIYFKCQLFYVDDCIDYISSSEGNTYPTNPNYQFLHEHTAYYTYYFPDIKHNLTNELCIHLINYYTIGGLAFKYASINEYDITILKYEDFYHCEDCNINSEKKFSTSSVYFYDSPIISTSNYPSYNTFCLNPTNNISIFYINENKINKHFYSGNTLQYLLNNDTDFFYINNSFFINGNENYVFDLDAVSLKIVNITNKKGNLFNEDEELFNNSFFNAKNEYIIHKKINDEGYLMIINIETKPRDKDLNLSTCEEVATIYLYVSQKNCTMNESSNDYCQNCKEDYGKYQNNCYHKSEKFDNLYYEDSNQIWNPCEINNNSFTCSICPKGTYIKNISSQICEKCPKGYYSNIMDVLNCEKCPQGYTSLLGSDKCYPDCEPGYYANGDSCIPCNPGFYSSRSSTKCSECSPGTYTNKEGMEKCLKCEKGTYNNGYKETKCNKCPAGYFSSLEGSTKCSECTPGTYSDKEGMDKCNNCEPGSYNNLFGQIKCFNCGKGYYSLLGSIECIKCPIGTFNTLIKNGHCEDCDMGYFNDQIGASQCKKCPINYYSDEKGLSYCKICKENKYSFKGFSKCKFCEDIIPHCNICSKDVKCLECNNNAVSGFDNCTICENTIDWKFTGEHCQLTICPQNYYYDKNNKIHCIGDISECPEGMDYLNSNTGECQEKPSLHQLMDFQYKTKGGKDSLNKASNDIIFQYKNFSDYIYEFFTKNKIKIEGLDSNLIIGLKDNLKNPDDTTIGVDLGNCPEIVRIKYGIKSASNIIYKVVDLTFNGTRYVDFDLYNTDDLETPLNKSYCENQTIKIINPPLDFLDNFENIEELETFFQIMKEGIDIFNAYSPIYNDPCFPLSVLNKYDLTLRDRRNFIAKQEFPLCEEGCQYEGENLKTFQVICYCQIKTDEEREPIANKIKTGFLSLKNRNNFEVLKCYKLVFSSKGQKYNFFSYIYIFLFVLNIFFIILTEIYYDDKLKKLINECKEYIVKNNSNNEKEKNIEFKKLREIYIKQNKNKKLTEEEKLKSVAIERCKNEKILNVFIAINNKDNDNDNNIESEINSITDNNNNTNNNGFDNKIKDFFICIINGISHIFNRFILFICGDDEIKYYYVFLIYVYQKKERKQFLIEQELNGLDYEYYINIENRKWYEIYISLFKESYDFIKTFLIYKEDYQFYTLKIIIYINSIILSIIINITFYTDDTMHKIYEDDGKYNLLYRLPKIFISDLSMAFISKLLEYLIDFQDYFIDIKINLDISNEEEIQGNYNINNKLMEKIKNLEIKSNEEKLNLNNKKNDNKNHNHINIQNLSIKSSERSLESKVKRRNIKNEKEKNKESRNISNKIIRSKKRRNISNQANKKRNISNKKEKILQNESQKNTKNVDKGCPNKEEQAKSIIKSFKIRKIIFYVLIVLINIFSWYYASCFCAVYRATQKHLFIDFIVGRLIILINCLIACLINIIIKVIVIKGNYSKIKKYILKIFNSEIFNFIIEKVIEFFIIKLITE